MLPSNKGLTYASVFLLGISYFFTEIKKIIKSNLEY